MGQFSQSTSLVHSSTNDTRLGEFMSSVRDLGRDEALGKDALPKLAHAVVRAVCDGVLDTAKDADGNDAATRVYHEYVKAKTKKQVHDRTESGLKANISKLRQVITFAGNPKWDAIGVMNDAFTIREKLEADGIEVKPAYAAYVDLAREQLKHDEAMSEDMIRDVMAKSAKVREVTLEGELEKMKKKIEGFITGEDKNGIKDQSPELIQVQELLATKLAALMQKRQDDEDNAKLAEIAARRAEREAVTIDAEAA